MSNVVACPCGSEQFANAQYIGAHRVLRLWPPAIEAVPDLLRVDCNECGKTVVVPPSVTVLSGAKE